MNLPSLLRPALAALALLLGSSAAAANEPLDRIIVVVNDGVILQSELDQAMDTARAQIRARTQSLPPEDALRAQVLERLILLRIQTQRAAQAGIRIDDRELNEVLSNIARQNGKTLPEFADDIRAQGQDYLAVREEIREQVLIQRLRAREVESHISVSDKEVDALLATLGGRDNIEYRLSHILVAIPDGASADVRAAAQAKADKLLERIKAGEDFAAIATAHSDGQQALAGGDLGWRRAADLPRIFADATGKLAPGQVSDVIETAGGFHIVKLEEQRGGEERQVVEETHARHILIKPNAVRDEDASRAQARELHARLVAGADFAELAKENSDDPGSKNQGGDLGFQPPGVFAAEFQQRIDALKPGYMSTPFHTQFGWHIAQVLERRMRDITDDARRARARTAIGNRKSSEEYDVWLRRLRGEAYVEYRLTGDAAAAENK